MDFKKEMRKLKEMYINGTFDKCEDLCVQILKMDGIV